jgi:hypothetical protein
MLPIINYFPCIDLCDQLLLQSDDFLSWFDGQQLELLRGSISLREDRHPDFWHPYASVAKSMLQVAYLCSHSLDGIL